MFNSGNWRIEIANNLGSYNALQRLFQDQKTIDFHLKNLPILTFSEDQSITTDNDERDEIFRKFQLGEIKKANQVYRRQMIVLVVSLIESLILEFFQCVFFQHPERLYDYLENNQNLIRVRLICKISLNRSVSTT